MNPTSPLHLPTDILDDSTGLRTKVYWASAISIIVAMPINFILNKLWTFRAVRGHHPPVPLVAPVVAPELVDEDGTPLEEPQERTGR